MISAFQNFSSPHFGYGGSALPDAAVPLYNGQQPMHPFVGHSAPAYNFARQPVYNAGQPPQYNSRQRQALPYEPAFREPYTRPQISNKHYEQVDVPPVPNRKRPASTSPPVQYTRVQGGVPGGKTSVHAVLDYDVEDDETLDYLDKYSKENEKVTPIQGPIFLRNGTVPVVPLFGYQKVSNGSFLQIPVLWTALSFALGYEINGDIIRGNPCIKRNHQLFCPTAGKSYPIDRIDKFIDENKALMKRMYGEFEMMENGPFHKNKRPTVRKKRQNGGFSDDQTKSNKLPTKGIPTDSGRIDSCESKVEVVTPYWAANSVGKTRAIVNTEHFEQAIHQEVCTKTLTSRCSGDCGCEQKYKWHRLLAYDPDNDCKGIFMDWFLFPSCCICRCDSTTPNNI
ncbi:protein spaetzle 3 [Daktulosphaira vitifoliae]|uniref:protein spaetzle 3 n=1 Tax=Daktulosphaira vitifoliae TaxID=58002 RepID=UPI0021AA3FA0|nr:protein spaetzle 3 [Daktulosphaira vitifoliae]XP_050548713.1 protein spaetzle 3 [Daktulosphaira vitifoliae]